MSDQLNGSSNHTGDETSIVEDSEIAETIGGDKNEQTSSISTEGVDTREDDNSEGPFQLIDILTDINLNSEEPDENIITCIEAWELNLYIGTNRGDIIHLYKIDDTSGYIQISRQTFSSTSQKEVKKILVLPDISVALIHCGTTVSGYLLPELSPANIGKAKEVRDISINWASLPSNKKANKNTLQNKANSSDKIFSEVTIFTKKSIKLLRIFKDSIRLYKELQYTDCTSGLQIGTSSIVSNTENYDLIDISKSQKIYLFPISADGDNRLRPFIRHVKNDEIVLSCGGKSEGDSAMVMFVNRNGDVVRGTLSFERYPSSIEVSYPYLLACFGNLARVYSIHDQSMIQEFNIESEGLKFHISAKFFLIKDEQLASKITLAPIVSTMDNEEIERIAVEADNAARISKIKSNCILYDESGKIMKILKPISDVDRWLQLFTSSNDQNYLENFDLLMKELNDESDMFLITLIALFSLKFRMFEQAFEFWTKYHDILDPRLLIYIIDENVDETFLGSVWTYQVLFDIIELIKTHADLVDAADFFNSYLRFCLKQEFKADEKLIGKIIEVEFVKIGLKNGYDLESGIHEVKYATNEIIELLLLNKRYYLLSRFYSRLNDHNQFLYYWKGLIDGEFQDSDYNKNFADINKALQYLINYISANCAADQLIVKKYSEWLLEKHPEHGLKLVTNKTINKAEINDIRVLTGLEGLPALKLQYLEYIFEQKNEKQFVGDMILIYLNLLLSMCKDPKLQTIMNKSYEDYLSMEVPKLSIYKYWKVIKDMKLIAYEDFKTYFDKIYSYLSFVSEESKSVLDQKLVLKTCEKELANRPNLAILRTMVLYKLNDFDSLIDELISIKDYKSAEDFANTLNLPGFDADISSVKMQNDSLTNDSTFKAEEDIETLNYLKERGLLTEKLLKKIFDFYLVNNEVKMIDRFLNKYDLLTDSNSKDTSMVERMQNFVHILNRVPDNFPLEKLHGFLSHNLIEFKDYSTSLHLKKNLIKLEVNRLQKLEENLTE